MTMTVTELHAQFAADEVIEQYVRETLGPDARRSFEEHLLECDACFEEVLEMQRFVSGIRAVSQAAPASASSPDRGWFEWRTPVLAYAVSGALVIGLGGWIWSLRASLGEAARQNVTLQHELQLARSERSAATLTEPPAAPLPLIILDANRTAAGRAAIAVPSGARQFALWIQVDAESPSTPLTVEIAHARGDVVETVSALAPNQYGALAVTLGAATFPAGTYRVRVYRDPHVLAHDYVLEISHP